MALKDLIPFGMSLPHRSPDQHRHGSGPCRCDAAEALGFRDLWVTENTLDHVTSFDPVVVLTYAAADHQPDRTGCFGAGPAGARSAHGGSSMGKSGLCQ